jgi:hypothetical protein
MFQLWSLHFRNAATEFVGIDGTIKREHVRATGREGEELVD